MLELYFLRSKHDHHLIHHITEPWFSITLSLSCHTETSWKTLLHCHAPSWQKYVRCFKTRKIRWQCKSLHYMFFVLWLVTLSFFFSAPFLHSLILLTDYSCITLHNTTLHHTTLRYTTIRHNDKQFFDFYSSTLPPSFPPLLPIRTWTKWSTSSPS